MKKSISINLSGILFHIEEDAYERLNQYLNEIKAYFNTIDSSGEVVQDIESRMAEVFTQKVGPSKQVITSQDVEQLIAQLGSVHDFAAAYGDEPVSEPNYRHSSPGSGPTTTGEPAEDKKLYRDASHKILGGVASGIARYLKIDAIWVRLFLVVILFDFFITFSFSTLTFISYIVLWIVLPERVFPREEAGTEKSKKMYRNPEDKVIGGVAGGLGAYFGTDPALLRILFVILFFVGGGGLLLYIILWVIMPEARTLTEKMRMKGEPVTLTNIEHQVKKKLNLPENEEESVLTRLLLFPFRLISAIFSGGGNGASSVASALGRLIRIVVGLFLAFIGFMLILALILGFLALFGAYPGINAEFFDSGIPIDWVQSALPTLLWVAVAVILFIPALLILLSGIAFLSSGWRLPREIGWGLGGLWIVAVVVALIMAPRVVAKFSAEGYHDSEIALSLPDSAQVLNLQVKEERFRSVASIRNENIKLRIEGTPNATLLIEQRAFARSESSEEAQELASRINIPVKQEGNTIIFTDRLPFHEDSPLSIQEVELVMMIPQGQRFTMSRRMGRILEHTLYPHDYGVSDLGSSNLFYYNQNNELVCENCPDDDNEYRSGADRDWRQESYSDKTKATFSDFSEISISGALQVEVRQEPEFSISYRGSESAWDDVKIEQRGQRLMVSRGLRWSNSRADREDLTVVISMPIVEEITLNGASNLLLMANQDNSLDIQVNGASELKGEVNLNVLNVTASGASEVALTGRCQRLVAEASAGSELELEDLRAQEVDIELSTAAEAQVFATEVLAASTSSGSELRYKGSPKTLRLQDTSGSTIEKLD